jgi:hypothetical protein
MSKPFPLKVGQKVTKTSGRWIGGEVVVKAIFPDINEILVENYDGKVEKVSTWDIKSCPDPHLRRNLSR